MNGEQLHMGNVVIPEPRDHSLLTAPGLRVGGYDTLSQQYAAWRATDEGRLFYADIRDRALVMRHRGFRRYRINALFEAALTARDLELGPDAQGFVGNHNWRAFMSRELMDREPELRGFFTTRAQRAA